MKTRAQLQALHGALPTHDSHSTDWAVAIIQVQVAGIQPASFVSFLGHIPEAYITEMLQNPLAIIFSSERDTLGNVMLVAMANGLLVVAFRHEGVICMLDD